MLQRCTITDLRDKEVINICDGQRLGFVSDAEIDVCDGKLVAIIVPGENKCFSFSREKDDDLIIPWNCIEKIGDDTILVKIILPDCRRVHDCECGVKHKKSFWQ